MPLAACRWVALLISHWYKILQGSFWQTWIWNPASLNVSLIADIENYLLDHCIEYGLTYSTCTLFELDHENEWWTIATCTLFLTKFFLANWVQPFLGLELLIIIKLLKACQLTAAFKNDAKLHMIQWMHEWWWFSWIWNWYIYR